MYSISLLLWDMHMIIFSLNAADTAKLAIINLKYPMSILVRKVKRVLLMKKISFFLNLLVIMNYLICLQILYPISNLLSNNKKWQLILSFLKSMHPQKKIMIYFLD